MILKIALFAVLFTAVVSHAATPAQSPKRLQGTFAVGGKTLVDPPPGEAKDTHLRIRLAGVAAKTMYDMMKVQAKYDECRDDGTLTKWIENTQCSLGHDKKTYECLFSIDVNKQKIDLGAVC